MKWIEGAPEDVLHGMLIQLTDGGVHLVGDINEAGGLCDCCSIEYRFANHIVRYAIAVEPQLLREQAQAAFLLASDDERVFMLEAAEAEAQREDDNFERRLRQRTSKPMPIAFHPEAHESALAEPMDLRPAKGSP